MAEAPASYSVVVPTIGRPQLGRLLASLAAAGGPQPTEIVVVDDRHLPSEPLLRAPMPSLPVRVLSSGGRGPAAARNAGWRATATEWVAFLDDDVEVPPGWCSALGADLGRAGPQMAGSQGRIVVPLPVGRRPSDWERNVAGLVDACWATADMAYRRDVLEEVDGFDERFPRAYREDADLGLRVTGAGWVIGRGDRHVVHPVRPAGPWVSVGAQIGNRDDVLMRAIHGPEWRTRAGAGPGRSLRHRATTAAMVAAPLLATRGRRGGAAGAAMAWTALTAEFALGRIRGGPRTAAEVAAMLATSAAIPPAATYHSIRGVLALPRLLGRPPGGLPRRTQPGLPYPSIPRRLRYGPVPRPLPVDPYWTPKAVLFDRDGTLIYDRHYLSDPAGVLPMPGARRALQEIRRAGLATGVVTNQSGVGRGLMTRAQAEAVNRRVEEVLGPFDSWVVCYHPPEEGCSCRKPAPGLVLQAAQGLGVAPGDCAVIGDIGADVEAARSAGARAVLVPTRRTRPAEVRAADQVAPDLLTAVDLVLGGRC